jgi:hypothetical protein
MRVQVLHLAQYLCSGHDVPTLPALPYSPDRSLPLCVSLVMFQVRCITSPLLSPRKFHIISNSRFFEIYLMYSFSTIFWPVPDCSARRMCSVNM